MNNWVIQSLLYDFNPSLQNYIKYKWYHFRFCKKDDPTITAALYIENIVDEVEHELPRQKLINKRSLTLTVIKKVLENKGAKKALLGLFEKKEAVLRNEELKELINVISALIHHTPEPSQEQEDFNGPAEFPVRTFVIATHIFLEINRNELHYESLIRDTAALKEFISAKFNAYKISGRIADMKAFSYKKILQAKNAGSAKGQLLPQIRQIANNPDVFGSAVSLFAENILKEHSDTTQ